MRVEARTSGRLAAVIFSLTLASVACASCGGSVTPMAQLICGSPALVARDEALNLLYKAALTSEGPVLRAVQRKWLVYAATCRSARCLVPLYDARNGDLLQGSGGRRLGRRFHFEDSGRANGDLILLRRGGWLTYEASETDVGRGGEAAGDVSAARLGGTVRFDGVAGTDRKAGGCEVLLQRNRDGSWSMATRHCFDGTRADLNLRFLPAT